jgi:hypothetical protein
MARCRHKTGSRKALGDALMYARMNSTNKIVKSAWPAKNGFARALPAFSLFDVLGEALKDFFWSNH